MTTNYGERPGMEWLATLPVHSAEAMRAAMREHDERTEAMTGRIVCDEPTPYAIDVRVAR